MAPRILLLLLTLLAQLLLPDVVGASRAKNLGTAASGRGSESGHSGGSGSEPGMRPGAECPDYCKRMRRCSNEQAAKEALLCGYDRTSRPVMNDSTQIRVHIAVALFHILDTDEKHQTFSALMSIRLRWQDEYLIWNPEEFNGTTNLHIPSSAIWTPDIVISNSADESSKKFMTTNVVAWHNGSVLWMFPAVVKVTCTLNVRFFPFDRQTCLMTFISWTYHLYEIDVWHDEAVDPNKNYYAENNQEWNVSGITFKRTEGIYACCKEPWPDVTIVIDMTRRSLFYVFNLIFPCLLMYVASFLGFFLPIESGEKVNLELTILLALVVFLLIVGDTLPPTPDAIPLVGLLFGVTMIMVSVALVMGVLVTNIHIRKVTSAGPPPWPVRRFVNLVHCPACRLKRAADASHSRRFRFPKSTSTSCPTSQTFTGFGVVGRRFPRSVASADCRAQSLYDGNSNGGGGGGGGGGGATSSSTRLTRLPSHLSLLDYETAALPTKKSDRRRRSVDGRGDAKRDNEAPASGISSSSGSNSSSKCICRSPEAWVAMARSVDRLMFWIFLLSSVAVMTAIYKLVPTSS